MAVVIQCDACGGSVVYDAEREAARCLFCGSTAVSPADLHEPVPRPDVAIPFEVSEHRAQAAFRRWATSSWWYPKALRELTVELSAVMLPAWRFDADVETHWAGLRSAATRSGVRPYSGVDTRTARALVPASMGIAEGELAALGHFDERTTTDFDASASAVPFEMPALSEVGALPIARQRMSAEHREAIAQREHLQRCRSSSKIDPTDARLLMLPVFIGSFRYRDLPWRFVINAQTGQITGRPPLDRLKIALVTLAIVAVAALWWWWSGGDDGWLRAVSF